MTTPPTPAAFDPEPSDSDTFDALLTGRSPGSGATGPLASFIDDVRMAAGGPAPAPKTELAAMLADGVPTEALLLPDRPSGHSHRRRNAMSKRSILARVGGLGLAKVLLGAGVAAASVTAASAADLLPQPAEDLVATVVSATTPFEIGRDDAGEILATVPGGAGGLTGTLDAEGGAGDVVTDGQGDHGTGTHPDNHGNCVSTAAHGVDPGPDHGKAVSEIARSDCGKPEHTTTTTTTAGGGDEGATSGSATAGSGANGHHGNPPGNANAGGHHGNPPANADGHSNGAGQGQGHTGAAGDHPVPGDHGKSGKH